MAALRINLEGARLPKTDWSEAVLDHSRFGRTNLSGANCLRTVFTGADLRNAILHGASLVESRLDRADLRGADLTQADFRGAILDGADLRGADLSGAVNLSCQQLSQAITDETTKLPADRIGEA